MRKLLFGGAVLVALGWIDAPQAYAFTKEPVFGPPDAAAPLADPNDRPPLFDHRFDGDAAAHAKGRTFRLPGGATLQFDGGSFSGQRDSGESRFFGRMPDSVQPHMR